MAVQSFPLWRRFLIFLVPLMISNILQALSGTLNSFYIGQLIGVDEEAIKWIESVLTVVGGEVRF